MTHIGSLDVIKDLNMKLSDNLSGSRLVSRGKLNRKAVLRHVCVIIKLPF